MSSRIKRILAKRLLSFVGDALPEKAADQADSTQREIQRAYTGLGAAFGQRITDQDITFAIKREPVAHRIVFAVAHDIYDNWLEAEPIEEEQDKEAFDEAVQKALAELNAKDIFTQAAVYERAYGWSIVVIGYRDKGGSLEDPLQDAEEIVDLEVYSPLQIPEVDEDEDRDTPRFGLPEIYTVMRSESERAKIHHSRVIHFATRLLNHPWKGISVLEPVWDDLTTLRNIRWGMGQTMYRYGSGFPVVTIEGATKEELREWSREWGPLTARTGLFKNETQEIDFRGLAGRALNPEPYYTPIMENISAGTTIPMAILRGAQAGQLAGSEVNEREYFKYISDCQSRYEPCVRQLIDELFRLGQVETAIRDYKINWLGGFEINPRDQAAAEYDKMRSLMLQTNWLTINEIRELQGKEAVPGGDAVLSLLRSQRLQPGTMVDHTMTERKRELQEKFGKPVGILLAERINNGDSVNKICRELGISTATFYDWARTYKLIPE